MDFLDNLLGPFVTPADRVEDLLASGCGQLQAQRFEGIIDDAFKTVEIEEFATADFLGQLLCGLHDVALLAPCRLRQQFLAVFR